MNIKELQDTLQNLINSKISQSDIAKALDVGRANISLRIKNNSKLNFDEVEKIRKYFKIDKMCETGFNYKMQNIGRLEAAQKFGLDTSDLLILDNSHNTGIELKYYPNVYLSAGYGVEVYDEEFEMVVIDERFLYSEKGFRVKSENCEIVRVSGNSMYPEYHHGDRVIIDKNDKDLTDGQIYAIRYDGQCYIKEINRAGTKIKCISINKEYESFFVERDIDFQVFGRIIPRVRL